ncbi:MAG: hypothetical protein KF846_12590 [Cyclobacteriaceae bacterium]|nr:hypothetical protein [Cyclobacteriaceae bacterium]
MKKLLLFSLLILPLTLFAKIWIVDSNSGSTSKDFTNLQEAHDGASAGDTLYLIGSGVSYVSNGLNVTKRLIIIGPGFFLTNPETQVSLQPAFLTLSNCNQTIVFSEGSAGSAIMGLTIRGTVYVNTNNILIKRNHFMESSISTCSTAARLTISGSQTHVAQNYFQAPNFGATITIVVTEGLTNVVIKNNYLSHACGIPSGCFEAFTWALLSQANTGIEVTNNVIQGGILVSNAIVRNNIFPTSISSQSFVTNNSVVSNNMTNLTFLPAGNGNINSVPINSIFMDSGTTDGRWKLKDGSPAIGSGYNGTDMGMFGGAEPYVLSGIPPIPTIYSLEAPLTGEKNTGLPIEIKAKSNN